jgi:hypothetical protein
LGTGVWTGIFPGPGKRSDTIGHGWRIWRSGDSYWPTGHLQGTGGNQHYWQSIQLLKSKENGKWELGMEHHKQTDGSLDEHSLETPRDHIPTIAMGLKAQR